MANSKTLVMADKMCPEHCDELLDMFCRKCHKLLCETCIKLYHLEHDWCKLSKLINEFHGYSNERARLIRESYIFGLRRNLTTVLALKSENAQKNFENIAGIIKKKEKIIEIVNEISDRLIKKCEKDYGRINEKFCEYETDLLKRLSDCEDIAHAYEESSDFISGYQYVKMEVKLKCHEHLIRPIDFSKVRNMVNFTESVLDVVELEKIFGKVGYEEGDDVDLANLKIRPESKDPMLYTLLPVAENQAWLKLPDLGRNQLVTNLMNLLEITAPCVDTDCVSFVGMDNGEQIFTRLVDMKICKMTTDGAVKELLSTRPYSPTGLSRSTDQGVLVALIQKSNNESYQSGILLHLSDSGDVIKQFEHYQNNEKPLFPHPFKVVQNYNHDLCIVDYLTTDKTKLRVITNNSAPKFAYSGQGLRRNLDISGLCCDSRCRIILCDCRNSVIHLLSPEGMFLRFLLTHNDGLEYPLTVALFENTLWVNCAFGKTKILKYEQDAVD